MPSPVAVPGAFHYPENVSFPGLAVSHRAFRFLLSCFVVVLQAMAPFIHAHAGTTHLKHIGFLHLHQGVAHADVHGHAQATDAHGTEVAVSAGLPVRNGAPAVPVERPPAAAPHASWPVADTHACVAGAPAPPAIPQAPPGYTRPPALAPPVA